MKILQLCHKPPFPCVDGGCIAMHNVTQGLLDEGHEVKIITAFTHKHDLLLESMTDDYKALTDIEGVHVDTRVNMVDAYASIITQDSYNVYRFFNADLDIRIENLLRKRKFDVIHIESLFMTPYIGTLRRFSRAALVLRSHNLEYIIWERMAHDERKTAKRIYLKYLAKKLREYEVKTMRDVDGIVAISPRDTERYQAHGVNVPVVTIPVGIATELYPFAPATDLPQSLFHIGAMDWQPNVDAVTWLVDEIFPIIRQNTPNASLHLAGRAMATSTSSTHGVTRHGEVPSAAAFMSEHSIMVVPLRSAGGIRVKIIEAMACGKAVITTSIGAEGIDGVNGEHFILADTAEDIAEAATRLLNDPERVVRMGKAARQLAESHFGNRAITRQLVAFYQTLIDRR